MCTYIRISFNYVMLCLVGSVVFLPLIFYSCLNLNLILAKQFDKFHHIELNIKLLTASTDI